MRIGWWAQVELHYRCEMMGQNGAAGRGAAYQRSGPGEQVVELLCTQC